MRIENVRLWHRSNLFCALVLCAVGCGQNGGSGGSEIATSIDGQFQITMASDWTVQSELNDEADIQAGNPFTECYLVVLSESKLDFDDPTVEWHSELTRSMLLESLTNQVISEPSNIQINGQPAVKYEIRGTTEGIKVVYLHTTVDTGEHLHQILAWTLPSHYDRNRPVLESAINSFKATSK